MSITSEQLTHIARLARLGTDADADETVRYASQLSRILDLVEQMNRIDTDHITPMSHPRQTALRLRPDKVNASDEANRREAYQRIAPATEQGLYLAPRVIE